MNSATAQVCENLKVFGFWKSPLSEHISEVNERYFPGDRWDWAKKLKNNKRSTKARKAAVEVSKTLQKKLLEVKV